MATAQRLIVVVDDEVHIQHVLSLKLREAGYSVLTADNGREALALVQQHIPDMVVTDYAMPHLTGTDLCEEMLRNPKTRDIPVLMLTARGFHLATQTLQSNIVTVMTKPFSWREVLSQIEDVLGGNTENRVNNVA